MPRNLTQNHLVQLLTDRLPSEERISMLREVKQDYFLHESYRELKKAYSSLVKVVKKPSAGSVDAILRYSQNQLNPAQA